MRALKMIDNPPPHHWFSVDGHRVGAYTYGDSENVLLALNGGPGLPSLGIRTGLQPVVERGWRLVSYDQLGTGHSDKPDDDSLWTIERYAREVEAVRTGLGLGQVHLLGHSWGGWLAIEYAVTYPNAIAGLILEGTCADMTQFRAELEPLRRALGTETEAMMRRYEAAGTFDHREYRAAITLLNYRHVWPAHTWSELLEYHMAYWNSRIYEVIQGPNEFCCTGNLKNWNRLDDLRRVTCPTLIFVGEHDHITPACSKRMAEALPNAELHVIADCGHGVMREAPKEYFSVLFEFLDRA